MFNGALIYRGLYSSLMLFTDDCKCIGSGSGPNIAADDYILGPASEILSFSL